MTSKTPNFDSVVQAVEKWWTSPAHEEHGYSSLDPKKQNALRQEVTQKLQLIFEACYGPREKWLELDLNTFDEDPVSYFDQVQDEFKIEIDSYPTNQELIDLILEQWKSKKS